MRISIRMYIILDKNVYNTLLLTLQTTRDKDFIVDIN